MILSLLNNNFSLESKDLYGGSAISVFGKATTFYTDPYKITVAELEKGGILYDKLICTFDKGSACIEDQIDMLINDRSSIQL